MWNKIVDKVLYSIKTHNVFRISKESYIAPNCKIRGATILGKVNLAEGVRLLGGVFIRSNDISIGRYSILNGPNTDLRTAVNPLKIGNFCSIARGATFHEFNHDFEKVTTYYMKKNFFGGKMVDEVTSKGPIILGNDVWIGANSTILSGVNIGNGAVIAANSVVTKDIPPYSIAGGIPCKVIRKRFEEDVVSYLQELKWWNWPVDRIKRNEDFFGLTGRDILTYRIAP